MKIMQFYSYIVFGLIAALFAGYKFHVYNLKKSAQHDIDFIHQMYRNRPRGNNVPYIPNISYPADINSEEEKNEWLLETVQKLSTID